MKERRAGHDARRTRAGWVLLALCFAAAPLYAEQADALARAADSGAFSAVHEARGLDLRDRFNRPVDRAALERGLRAGLEVERRAGAALAGLPKLVALIEYLDRARALRGLKAERRDGSAKDELRALPPPRDPKLRALKPGTVASVGARDRRAPLSPLQFSTSPGRARVLPLRL